MGILGGISIIGTTGSLPRCRKRAGSAHPSRPPCAKRIGPTRGAQVEILLRKAYFARKNL
ncbi:hypothetical protein CK247_29560, partial [Klebsiella pneumoniae]